ncbi:MAG: DMT family transporter [Acidobacteriota bacterium]|nr:DMT family transporter [Acidobacteriota bacterium]MDQ2841035.1 DMT family transporter [Acidobacteriota bacterium]
MKILFYIFTMFLGIVLAVHLSMNGKVGSMLGNPRVANALFWCIGAATALIIGLTGWRSNALDGLRNVHPLLLTAGALGACLVFAIAWLIPQVGARAMFITLIAGQVFGGMILSHYGWLGSPIQRVSLTNMLGALVMIGGVVLATYSR